MRRFPTNGADRHPMLLFVDVVKHPKGSHAKLPDWRDGLKRRREVAQELAFPCFNMRCMSQLRLDGLKHDPAVVCAEAPQVLLDPLRPFEGEQPGHAYTIAYSMSCCQAYRVHGLWLVTTW